MLRIISFIKNDKVLHCYLKRWVSIQQNVLFEDSRHEKDSEHEEESDSISQSSKSDTDSVKEFPEEPTTCCMSGCANCVWLDYAEKLSEYFKDGGEAAIQEIEEKVQDPNIKAFLLTELRMRLKKQSK